MEEMLILNLKSEWEEITIKSLNFSAIDKKLEEYNFIRKKENWRYLTDNERKFYLEYTLDLVQMPENKLLVRYENFKNGEPSNILHAKRNK